MVVRMSDVVRFSPIRCYFPFWVFSGKDYLINTARCATSAK